ncbi:MAG: hypothetical protein WBQ21_04310 [Solirubrobacteraceae bacterium]
MFVTTDRIDIARTLRGVEIYTITRPRLRRAVETAKIEVDGLSLDECNSTEVLIGGEAPRKARLISYRDRPF